VPACEPPRDYDGREPLATLDKLDRTAHWPERVPRPSLAVVVIIAAIAVGLAALFPLIQSSGATTTNGRLQRLRQEQADWEALSQELEVEVATLGGLERIEQEAKRRFQMVPAQETIYLPVDVAGPEPPKLPSRFLPQPERPPPAKGSSIWDKLFGWIPWP